MLDCVWCVVNDWEIVLNRALSFYISACTILRCLFINPVFFEHDFCIKLFKYCNWSTISRHWQGIVWFSWFSFRLRAHFISRAQSKIQYLWCLIRVRRTKSRYVYHSKQFKQKQYQHDTFSTFVITTIVYTRHRVTSDVIFALRTFPMSTHLIVESVETMGIKK